MLRSSDRAHLADLAHSRPSASDRGCVKWQREELRERDRDDGALDDKLNDAPAALSRIGGHADLGYLSFACGWSLAGCC